MIDKTKIIEREVLDRITPDAKEKQKLKKIIRELKDKISQEINKRNLDITITLVGSTAKDTFLSKNLDIDLFLCFPVNTTRKELEKYGLSIARKILSDSEECYAEHPYLRGKFRGYETEIVPCYKIESASQKLSAVDRTPLHTKYVLKNLKESQKNDVRLFKQFLKGIGCYGAEAEIEGFSGYLCEILVIYYKTFHNLITSAKDWNYQKCLTLTKESQLVFDTPLVFIDPVDLERNVASALSIEKFNLFVHACKEYSKNPKINFFFPNKIKPWSIAKIESKIKNDNYLGISFKKPDIISENLYPQVRKALKSVVALLSEYDFEIIDSSFHINEKNVYLIIKPKEMTIKPTKIHMGPPTHLEKHASDFSKKWKQNHMTVKQPYEKEKRLYVEIKRQYTETGKLLKDKFTDLSLGKHIIPIIKKDFSILDKQELITNNLREFWTEHLDKKMPWER